MKLSELAAAIGCAASVDDVIVDSVVTDSRKVHYGALFAALQGSQVDGHDFAGSAVGLGATALLLERHLDLDVPQLVVDDVLLALGKIATLLRRRIDPIVFGITGSNGKTTVKELLAGILRIDGEVLATHGNYNNELGVPLSLFGLEPRHRYAVIEMGASKAGDIAYLASIAGPNVGLVTNIGPAHLQGFRNEAGVARAKGEIFASLPADGWAIFNGDEQWLQDWKSASNARNWLTFGASPGNDVCIGKKDGAPLIETPSGSFEVNLKLPGEHNLINAAAATAAALALQTPLASIRIGLQSVAPVPGRLSLSETAAGWTVIDDTYNANPASLYSALQVLTEMQGSAWLVLGDMKELGPESRKLHAEVGDAARAMGVARLFATGEMSAATVDSFGEGAIHFPDQSTMIEALCAELHPGITCLVKGSRSMGMERVVKAISGKSCMREAS